MLCTGFLLMGNTSFAGNDVDGIPQASPAVATDQQIEALLFKAEQQIAAGRTVSPADDNAMTTWLHLLERAFPASPGTLRAFADFAARARNRSADEQTAGKPVASSDFQMFADLATKVLAGESATPAASVNSPSATAQPVPEGHTLPGLAASVTSMAPRNAPSSDMLPRPAAAAALAGENATPASSVNSPLATAQPVPEGHTSLGLAASVTSMAPRNAPSSDMLPHPVVAAALAALQKADAGAVQTQTRPGSPTIPDASVITVNAARPKPATGNTPTAFAVPTTRSATGAPTAQEQSMAALYVSRGDEMMAIKDISAARKFYEYAANAGNARAAMALARTHDPAFLTRSGALGLRSDPVLAAAWYRKAAALGDPDAEARLHALSTEAAK